MISQLGSHTYWQRGGTNTGIVVSPDDQTCLLIDPGKNDKKTAACLSWIEQRHLNLSAVLITHEHEDHFLSYHLIHRRYPAIRLYASKEAIIRLKGNRFFYNNPPFRHNGIEVDTRSWPMCELNSGRQMIKDIPVSIFSTPGHTYGHVIIKTADNLLFLGDLLLVGIMQRNFGFPFINQINDYIQSLEKIQTITFQEAVVGHDIKSRGKEDVFHWITKNRQALEKCMDDIMGICKQPRNFLDIFDEYYQEKSRPFDPITKTGLRTSIIAVITYLLQKNKLIFFDFNQTVFFQIREG